VWLEVPPDFSYCFYFLILALLPVLAPPSNEQLLIKQDQAI